MSKRWRSTSHTLAVLALALAPGTALAVPEVTFQDVADPEHGVQYRRIPSPNDAIVDALRQGGTADMFTVLLSPLKAKGAPGVALLDFDGDGDLDLYVTNGPRRPNSLYSNQLRETGAFGFVDVARQVGVGAADQDSSGVCFGDIDNDGDPDLLVLGAGEPNRLFENRRGRFVNITAASGLGGGNRHHSSCAFGDVNGDGRLDVFVANTFDWVTKMAIVAEPFALNEPNQLYLNRGGNRFRNVSTTAGIKGPVNDISWAVTIFDYDEDGDADILVANDQGAIPPAKHGGVDRGFIRVLQNDGTGRFTDVTFAAGLTSPGSHMGFAVADFNADRHLDISVSNIGDWIEPFLGIPYTLGDQTTRWYLARGDGTFSDPGVGPLVASGWSWGISALDYDNDGDFDIAAYGGVDMCLFIDESNPGTLLKNDGRARFGVDTEALAGAADHVRRNDHGLAVGDLDGNGFEDIVSVSDENRPVAFPFTPYPFAHGSYLDGIAGYAKTWEPTGNGTEFRWAGTQMEEGTLAIELNSGGNGNGWVEVDTVGAVGRARGGRVNRDGIGAVVRFTPAGGKTVSQPILGGSSLASQDSLIAHFGTGDAGSGVVEVVWPGGARNRLYDVESGERVRFPEIPCSFAADWRSFNQYRGCVRRALNDLVSAGTLTPAERERFLASALRAFGEAQ